MNLDELSDEIADISSDRVVQDLSRFLIEWKENEETAEHLRESIERYLGNTRIDNEEDFEKVYRMWASFRDKAIIGIGGMTMNERLYFFSLSNRFEGLKSESDKLLVYEKLHAKP